MKNICIFISVLLFSINSRGQVTYQHSYYVPNTGIPINATFNVVDLLLSGKKYCFYDFPGNKVVLYNLNHTLWKTIIMPNVPGFVFHSLGGQGYPSENLFKIDNKVDMAMLYQDTVHVMLSCVIFDETSTIINKLDSVQELVVHNIGIDSFVAFARSDRSNIVSVYSLPGKIPCNICGSGLGLGVPPSGNSGGGSSLISNPVPNPSSGSVKIEYSVPPGTTGIIRVFNTMGKELKSYKVDHNFDYITLDNTELPSGIYYYNLTTSDMQTSAKRMIVVR